MAQQKVILSELNKALAEINAIVPWWSDEDGLFVFEHAAYPMVMAADADRDRVIELYRLALQEFIAERLRGNVADFVESLTSGRGGARPGAGRPKNKAEKVRRYIPSTIVDIVEWLEDEENAAQVRKLMDA